MGQQIMVPMVKIEVKGSKDALYINPTAFIAVEYCEKTIDDHGQNSGPCAVYLTLASQNDTMVITGDRAESFMKWFRRFMGEDRSAIEIPQLNTSRLKIT